MILNQPRPVGQINALPPNRKQRFEAAVKEVAEKHKIPRDTLLGRERIGVFVTRAKNELCYILRARYNWSLTVIAKLVNVDHTIVRYRISRHHEETKEPLPGNLKFQPRRPTRPKRSQRSKPCPC